MVLLAGLLGSCTASDNLPEASADAAVENGSFVIDPKVHYIINGAVTHDFDAVKMAAKAAWNVHFDDPKNRVVISTTPAEFEKYIDSNLELKNAMENNEYNSKVESAKISQRSTAIPTGGPATVVSAYEDKSVIACSYNNSSNEKVFFQFVATYREDCGYMSGVHRMTLDATTGNTISDFQSGQINFRFIFQPNTLKFIRIYLNNEHGSNSLTKTFYSGLYYSGSSYTYTAAKHGNVSLGNLTSLQPYSFR